MGIFSSVKDLVSDPIGVLSGSRGYKQAAGNVNFTPFNIRSGIGSTSWDGRQGTFSLTPEYQKIRDQLLGGAGGFLSQGMTFDPNQASANAYGLLSSIAAPERARTLANLRDTLYSQGRLGAAGPTGANPELQAYYEAMNQADLQNQLTSIGLGQNLLDSMLSRGTGLLSGATGLDQSGQDMFRTGLFGGSEGLKASTAQAGFMGQAGAAESKFWNQLIGAGAQAFGGIPGGFNGAGGIMPGGFTGVGEYGTGSYIPGLFGSQTRGYGGVD